MVNCEISALLIWIDVANRAGGGTDPPKELNSSPYWRGQRWCQGLAMGSSQHRWSPTDHWSFSVVSVARIRCVPPEARPSLLREREVTGSEKMLKQQWIPFTGWMKLVFCFGSKIKTKPSQALAVSCQWIPTSPWALEFTPNQPRRGK